MGSIARWFHASAVRRPRGTIPYTNLAAHREQQKACVPGPRCRTFSGVSKLDDDLGSAAMRREEAKVKRLLDKGAAPKAGLYGGVREPAILRLLLDAGLDPRGNAVEQYSPLCMAARGNRAECVRMLLAAGAHLEETDTVSRATPLMLAAEALAVESVDVLLAHGANPNARDHKNCTPLMYAVMLGDPEVVEIVRALVRAGADTELVNDHGQTFWDITEDCRHDRAAMREIVIA
jgi:uncharacterized protein